MEKNPYKDIYYTDELKQYYPHTLIGPNCAIVNPALVSIGENVTINFNSSISIINAYIDERYSPTISIGEGTQIGAYNAFAAIDSLTIGNNVLFAAHVTVTDHSHDYKDTTKPIMFQGIASKGPVVIEDGCWIGFGSHILSGVTIGKNSVIGANSVVTKDIPPYCVAVGSPAKVIKKYNFDICKWENINYKKIFYFIDQIKNIKKFLNKF